MGNTMYQRSCCLVKVRQNFQGFRHLAEHQSSVGFWHDKESGRLYRIGDNFGKCHVSNSHWCVSFIGKRSYFVMNISWSWISADHGAPRCSYIYLDFKSASRGNDFGDLMAWLLPRSLLDTFASALHITSTIIWLPYEKSTFTHVPDRE